jgi:hypothetical protein
MKRPTVAEQIKKAGVPATSALAKLISENQDLELLHPDELNDEYPAPLWLRVAWRKQNPQVPMPSRNPGAAYPEILSQIYKRMVANPDQPWGPNAPTTTPGTAPSPTTPVKRKSPRRKA